MNQTSNKENLYRLNKKEVECMIDFFFYTILVGAGCDNLADHVDGTG